MKPEIKERIDKINRGQVPEGYKKSKFGIIPEDWDIKKLKEVTDYVDYRGKTPRKVAEGVFLVTAKNIKEGYIDYNISKEYVSEEEYDLIMKRGKPKIGDVLFTTEAPLGNVAQVDRENIALAQRVIKFRGKNNLSNDYLKYYLLGEIFQSLLKNKAIGSTVLGIQGKQLHNLEICVPLIEEQQKIADILSTWDKAIELKEKLIEQKKELMQKLLTGEVRLPGYKYSWKVYTIEQLAEFFTDGDWIEAPYITEDGVLLIQTGNIGIGEYIEKNNMKFISEKSFIELNCTEVKPGDILICRLADPIGRSCIVPNTGMKMITAVDVAIFRVNNNLAVTEFINYKLNLPKTLRKMDSLGAGSTRKRISRKNLGKVKLTIPDLEEQKAIVDILLQIEKNIVLLEKELGELKKQKKGLMQLLLTGKVRVKV